MDVVIYLAFLLMRIICCRSQQCLSTNFKLVFKNNILSSDYRPLLVTQDNNYGITFHKCLHLCSESSQCIGFYICRVMENVFECQTCCNWKKIKGYEFGNFPNCKYVAKVTLKDIINIQRYYIYLKQHNILFNPHFVDYSNERPKILKRFLQISQNEIKKKLVCLVIKLFLFYNL